MLESKNNSALHSEAAVRPGYTFRSSLCVLSHSTMWKRNPCRAEVGWAMAKRFLPLDLSGNNLTASLLLRLAFTQTG